MVYGIYRFRMGCEAVAANYEYYRIFYYVGKYRSISRAAKMLSSSQPNVTRAMNNLEAQLGCKLLVRSTKGIELTATGKQLYEHVSVAVEHIRTGEREISSAQALETGELFVAATEIALHRVLLPTLQQFRMRYPGIRIRVSNFSTPEAVAAVQKEQAELAVVSLADTALSGVSSILVTTYSECLTAGLFYKALAGKTSALRDLTEYPWVSLSRDTQTFRFYDKLFLQQGISFEPDIQAATVDQILPMVQRDLGLAFLPDFIARPSIADGTIIEVPLKDTIPDRSICIVYREKKALSAPAKELVRILQPE